MSTYTKNLNLFKYDVTADEKVPFSITDALNNNWDIIDEKCKGSGGLEVCDIGMALYVDETKGLRRYLNGQIVDINTNTQKFLDRLKQITTLHPSLLCTEEEWQTAKTMSAFGQVGKFVFNYSGGDIISVRLPRVVNVQGLFDLQNLGMTVEAGLPTHTHTRGTMNITGTFKNNGHASSLGTTGAFTGTKDNTGSNRGGANDGGTYSFDASRSWTGSTSAPNNSIYGASNTVQQEAIQYPYFIQIATGQETENNIVNDIELNNPYSLFDSKYSDHELFNLSWLLANGTFNGSNAVHPSAYQALLVENNAEVAIGSTVTLPNGAKYTKQGLSVKLSTETYTDYDFVLNMADETFRLPLLNGSESLLSDNYTELSFPAQSTFSFFSPYNGWASLNGKDSNATGSFYAVMRNQTRYFGTASGFEKDISSAWRANVLRVNKGDKINIYTQGTIPFNTDNFALRVYKAKGNGTLYFYVGETVQNAKLIDAGRIGEILPTKVSKSGDTMTGRLQLNGALKGVTPLAIYQQKASEAGKETYGNILFKNSADEEIGIVGCVEYTDGSHRIRLVAKNGSNWTEMPQIDKSYHNGASWYRKYTDGFIEQGFFISPIYWGDNEVKNFALVTPFATAEYTVNATPTERGVSGGNSWGDIAVRDISTTSINIKNGIHTTTGVRVYACGY